MKSVQCFPVCSLLALLTGLGAPCLAQPGRRLESPPDRSVVAIISVKPEMISEWLDLQKTAVILALKRSGVKTRAVYTSAVFGSAFEYILIQPLSKFADFDAPEAQAQAVGSLANPRMADQLRRCVSHTSTFLSTALPELSNPPPNGNAPIVQFLRLRIAPGKMEEYQRLYKSDVVPALKEANANVTVASWRLGTDGYDLTFATPLTKFADLDAPPPLLQALGPEEVARITARLNDLATVAENTILIRVADLSY
jgi:hypothetical protein